MNNTSTQNKILRHKTTGLYFNGYGYHEPKAMHAMQFNPRTDRMRLGVIDDYCAEMVDVPPMDFGSKGDL